LHPTAEQISCDRTQKPTGTDEQEFFQDERSDVRGIDTRFGRQNVSRDCTIFRLTENPTAGISPGLWIIVPCRMHRAEARKRTKKREAAAGFEELAWAKIAKRHPAASGTRLFK
jgi:hypothetical protein